MGDQQRIDDMLMPSGLICLPAVMPKVCVHTVPCVSDEAVSWAILKGKGQERQDERRRFGGDVGMGEAWSYAANNKSVPRHATG